MTADKDGVELLPCPNVLCDLSRPFLNETDAELKATHTWVSCENCGACGPRIENPSQYFGRTSDWDQVKREAIAAWNTRPTPAQEQGLRDVFAILQDAPELNPSNYDHEQVCELNAKMVEAYLLVQSLLPSTPTEGAQ